MLRQSRVLTRTGLLARGWTDTQIGRAVRAGQLARAFPGTYVAGDGPLSTRERVECVQAHLGGEVVAVLGTAAELHGLPVPWPTDGRTHVALPPGREQVQREHVCFHSWQLAAPDVVDLDGMRATSVARTLVDLMCTVDQLSAVAAVDAALHRDLVRPDLPERMPAAVRRRRGAARSRGWWALADGRAESPLETRVRLRAFAGGYPPDELQRPVTVDGHRFRADLAWWQPNGRLLLVEADGDEHHGSVEAAHADRRRANAIISAGDTDLARVVWADTTRPEPVPALLARFLGPPRGRRDRPAPPVPLRRP